MNLDQQQSNFKSGFVAILGRSNVGKSSIMNAFVGEKIAIVSDRPQTTRNKILGVLSRDDWQIVFVDTPGIHTPTPSWASSWPRLRPRPKKAWTRCWPWSMPNTLVTGIWKY